MWKGKTKKETSTKQIRNQTKFPFQQPNNKLQPNRSNITPFHSNQPKTQRPSSPPPKKKSATCQNPNLPPNARKIRAKLELQTIKQKSKIPDSDTKTEDNVADFKLIKQTTKAREKKKINNNEEEFIHKITSPKKKNAKFTRRLDSNWNQEHRENEI